MERSKERNSNFELLRIVSMLMIVLWHFICHSNILMSARGSTYTLLIFISGLIQVHVNSFVLLSGYFQYKQKMRLSKAIKLNNSIWFYSSVILILFCIFGSIQVSKVVIFKTLLPISYNDYWFFSAYLILYLISPAINVVINNSDKEKLKKIIIASVILMCILPYITNMGFYNNNGYTLYNFVILYMIGAYLSKYPIQENYFMKVFTLNKQKLILFISVFIFAIINFLLWEFGHNLVNSPNGLIRDFGSIFVNNYTYYSNPLLMLQSISYFLLFSLFNFKSKFINRVAKYVLGVYLISDNNYVREWMYTNIWGLTKAHYSYKVVFYILGCSLIVFTVCIIIEAIRQFIFKKIYDTKFAYKFRTSCRNYIASLGININW